MGKSVTVKAAYIGVAGLVFAAMVTGIFQLFQVNNKKIVTSNEHSQSPVIVADQASNVTINYNIPSSATEEAIRQFEHKLESANENIELNRKEVKLLTQALKDLDQRTSGIEKLPDGRTRMGNIIGGNPTVVLSEHNAAIENYKAGDFQKAFSHSANAIKAHETTPINGLSSGNLSNDALGKIYYLGAINSQRIENNNLAVEWAQKSVQVNPIPMYHAMLATALFNNGMKEAAQKELAAALEKDPNNKELIRLKSIIDSKKD